MPSGIYVTLKGCKKCTPIFWQYSDFYIRFCGQLFPKYVSTLKEVALAMINSVIYGYEKSVLEVPDLIELSKRK